MGKIIIGRDKTVFNGKFIKTISRPFRGAGGKEYVWEMVEHQAKGRIIAIVAITPEGDIILEKNFRLPFKDYIIELPAGLMDVAGEPEEDCARRELLEETGYKVDKLELLLAGPYNAGLTSDEMAIYFGVNAVKIQEPELEGAEDIEVFKVPLKNLFNYLNSLNGAKADLKIASIIPYLQKRGLSV